MVMKFSKADLTETGLGRTAEALPELLVHLNIRQVAN
jgi:hypothetical protein